MALTECKTPCWIVACDRCGEGDEREHGGCYHHASRGDAVAQLRDSDWVIGDDGSAVCWECFSKSRAEIACPHGAGCTGGECGHCPTDEAILAHAKSTTRVGAVGAEPTGEPSELGSTHETGDDDA